MDQNDHGGDARHHNESGEKDQYGGDRNDNAPANVSAQQVEARERWLREQSAGRCPQCGAGVYERSVQGVTLLECRPCQGIWLNKDKLPTFAQPGGGAWFESFLRGLGWWRPFHCD